MSNIYPTLKVRKRDAVVQTPEKKSATTFRTSIIFDLEAEKILCEFDLLPPPKLLSILLHLSHFEK